MLVYELARRHAVNLNNIAQCRRRAEAAIWLPARRAWTRHWRQAIQDAKASAKALDQMPIEMPALLKAA